MTRWSRCALWLVLGTLLLWSAVPAQAQTNIFFPIQFVPDPAHLAAAAAVFVKVDAKSGTDTLLVVNRQQIDGVSTTGAAIPIHVRFYAADCTLKFDNNVSLTPQGVFVGLVSTLFGTNEPGVVLADSYGASTFDPKTDLASPTQFALSGVVIDGNFGALYERQGLPLVDTTFGLQWAGFSVDDLDDWFIGGFTMLQMMCPATDVDPGTLGFDMHELAVFSDVTPAFPFAEIFPVVNVYDAKEVLKRSIHEVPCFCNTDSAFFGKDSRGSGYPGDFADLITSMKTVGLGTFHWDDPNDGGGAPAKLVAWRVISDGKAVYWDARLRTTSPLFGIPVK